MYNIKIILATLLLITGCAHSPAYQSSLPASSLPAVSSEQPLEAQTAPPAVEPAADIQPQPEFYSLFKGDERYFFTPEGEMVPEEQQYSSINDPETETELYRVYSKDEDIGKDDPNGLPIVEHYNALYDAEGNMLCDWDKYYYQPGTGKLVIRHNLGNMYMMAPHSLQDGQSSCLFDPVSGEVVLEGIFTLTELSNGVYMALDTDGKLLGTIDRDGNILAGFPSPVNCYYPSVHDGYIQGSDYDPFSYISSKESQYFILDENLNVIFKGGNINMGFVGLRGPYFLHEAGPAVKEVISFDTRLPIFSYDPRTYTLDYFDGELMILRSGNRPDWKYTLCNAEGNAISEQYDRISSDYMQWDQADLPADIFLAQQGETVMLLDRSGKVTAQNTLPGADRFDFERSGFYSYSSQGALAGDYSTGILDSDLKVVIPAEKYLSINMAANYSSGKTEYYPLWLAYHQVNGSSRCDVLDINGELLISNLTTVGTIGPDRIAVVRGFSMGLMDLEGSWIAKHSVYNSLGRSD